MAEAEEVQDVTLTRLTKVFLKIKAKRAENKKEFDAQDESLIESQEAIKKALLQHCKDSGMESGRTTEGTFYRQVKTKYWTSDWESMHKFVLDHGVPEFLEKRLNQTVLKQYLEENPDESPMGLNIDSEYTMTISKPRSK